ncbi:MAG: cation:dicarboxylase symporter family transporter [Cyanobacteria bacterium P01_H01_bin.74]
MKIQKPNLIVQVVAGMLIGILLGQLLPDLAVQLKPVSTMFLRMIKMLIAPLIFSTLVIGIAGTGNHLNLGRLGLKTLIYFELATIPALIIGLLVANIFRPGSGVDMARLGQADSLSGLGEITGNIPMVQNHSLWDTLVNMIPTSVIDAMARGDILQVVVFSVFFALAMISAGDKAKPVLNGLQSLSEIMFQLVNKVMLFAPLGVTAAIAATVGANGLGILLTYAKLVGALYFALFAFVFSVLWSACLIAKVPFIKLMKAIKEPFLLAFSTASSESAMPKAMHIMQRFGVPKNVVSFVIPTGYSFNLDGSTLYVALAALFIAQMAHVEMNLQQQILLLITLMITTKGIAAVPKASLVVLAATVTAFNLPMAGIAVILGVDHFLDMGRTAINLVGNCVASTVIARWEGVLDDRQMAVFGTIHDKTKTLDDGEAPENTEGENYKPAFA